MSETPELVRELLARLILKGVRVHRIEVQPARTRKLAEIARVIRLVPWNVQGHCGSRAHELEDRAAVFELLVDIARLARTGEPVKASPARSNSPRRNCYAEGLRSGHQLLDVDLPAPQHASEMIVVFFEPPSRFAVLFSDKPVINLKTSTHCFSRSFSIFHFPFSICHLSFVHLPLRADRSMAMTNDKWKMENGK